MGTATADREPAMAADSSSFGDMAWLWPELFAIVRRGENILTEVVGHTAQ